MAVKYLEAAAYADPYLGMGLGESFLVEMMGKSRIEKVGSTCMTPR